jgi:hypothetical protein
MVAIGHTAAVLEVLFRKGRQSGLQLADILFKFELDVFELGRVDPDDKASHFTKQYINLVFFKVRNLFLVLADRKHELFEGEVVAADDHAINLLTVLQESVSHLFFLHITAF